jgi:hypothetical protein
VLGARHCSGAVFLDASEDARLESRAPSDERLYRTPSSFSFLSSASKSSQLWRLLAGVRSR